MFREHNTSPTTGEVSQFKTILVPKHHLRSMALERQVAPALQMINFVSADNIYSGATFGAQMIAVERRYTGRASVPA
jgi:hypothetical protein